MLDSNLDNKAAQGLPDLRIQNITTLQLKTRWGNVPGSQIKGYKEWKDTFLHPCFIWHYCSIYTRKHFETGYYFMDESSTNCTANALTSAQKPHFSQPQGSAIYKYYTQWDDLISFSPVLVATYVCQAQLCNWRGPVQNENTECLVTNVLRITRWWQQSIKPRMGPF